MKIRLVPLDDIAAVGFKKHFGRDHRARTVEPATPSRTLQRVPEHSFINSLLEAKSSFPKFLLSPPAAAGTRYPRETPVLRIPGGGSTMNFPSPPEAATLARGAGPCF